MKKLGYAAILAALLLAFAAGTMVQVPQKEAQPRQELIGADKAQRLALDKAGLDVSAVRFDRTELDKEKGVFVYEVEFHHGKTEYDAKIRAEDGAILKWDVERD